MDEAAVRAAFDTRLEDKISISDVLYPNLFGIPVTWENTPNKTDKFWIRVQLILTDTRNGTIGAQVDPNPYIVLEGFYTVSIFTKLNIGTKQASDIGSELVALFQNKTFAGVWAQVIDTRKIGDDEHGYYHVNVLIPFTTVS